MNILPIIIAVVWFLISLKAARQLAYENRTWHYSRSEMAKAIVMVVFWPLILLAVGVVYTAIFCWFIAIWYWEVN